MGRAAAPARGARPLGGHAGQAAGWHWFHDLFGWPDKRRAYHLLVLGGDQLYSDEIWGQLKTLRDWNDLPDKKKGAQPSEKMRREIESFYFNLYLRQWSREGIRDVLASIPSLMMWDDHDIFDGWGSYSEKQQGWPVFQAIF